MLFSARASRGGSVLFILGLIASLIAIPQAAGAVEIDAISTVHHSEFGGGARYRFRGTEKCLMKHINRTRRAHGMRHLEWDRQLGFVARRHAGSMASSRAVWHDGNLGAKVTRWRRLGQNTARADRCREAFRKLMRSYYHRANILGHFRFIGVGTDWGSGKLYIQQVFESRRNPGNIYRWP